MCDIDGIDDPTELKMAFERLSKDPHVILIYRTISGRGLSIQKISQAMRKCGFNSIQRSGYELFLVVEIPYDQQQNYLSLEKDESQNLEEEIPQTLDNQQLDLPF